MNSKSALLQLDSMLTSQTSQIAVLGLITTFFLAGLISQHQLEQDMKSMLIFPSQN